MLQLADNHIFLRAALEVESWVDSMLSQHPICIVVYGRYYPNGESIILTNSKKWFKHHLQCGYMFPAPFDSPRGKSSFFNIINDRGKFYQAKHDLINLFGSRQGVDIISREEKYHEVFCYGFSSQLCDNDAINYFCNNHNEFVFLREKFKKDIGGVINEATEQKIVLPKSMQGCLSSEVVGDREKTLKQLKALSNRQMAVLYYLMLGHTSKEIAQKLEISSRTVEQYLNSIKDKLDCYRKSDIINKCIKTGIMQIDLMKLKWK